MAGMEWPMDGITATLRGKWKRGNRYVVPRVCRQCGARFWANTGNVSVGNGFLCSNHCRYLWDAPRLQAFQKSAARRQRLAERNRTPENRVKVSNALHRRKAQLGDAYHSPEAKHKIGRATRARWGQHRFAIEPVLRQNALDAADTGRYGHSHRQARQAMLTEWGSTCMVCGSPAVCAHHILPVRCGGWNHATKAHQKKWGP